MLEGFSGASRIPELRRRLVFTALALAVYRIGVAVPTPGIDGQALASFFEAASGTLFGQFNLFSGGAFERLSVFALGIMPYISVSIILDLLKVASPYLDELYKEGEAGRRKITTYIRYGTVGLSIVQGFMLATGFERMMAPGGAPIVLQPGWYLHHHRDHPYRRRHVRHVDRRADHRARHRQRHLTGNHGRNRGASAQRAQYHCPIRSRR